TPSAPIPPTRSQRPSPVGSSSPSLLSAGNLFAPTRTDQPGALDALPGPRTASTSSGGRVSWPAQNAQGPALTGCAGVDRKSDGRRDRSVEMITQRATMGSRRSSGTDGALLLGPRLACEQGLEGVAHRPAVEEHRRHLLADRHGHALGPGQRERGGNGAYAFGDHGRRALDLGQAAPARDPESEGMIAALRARAGEHEISQAGQPGHGGGPPAQGQGKSADLGQSPRDEGGAGILPEVET